MSNAIKKILVPTASKESNLFNLSCRNITTMDFFKLKPVYTREIVPNSHFECDLGVFTRLSPLVKPAYAECNIITRGFFVPFRTVLDGWNEFITDTTYKKTRPFIPSITMTELRNVFVESDYLVSEDLDDDAFRVLMAREDIMVIRFGDAVTAANRVDFYYLGQRYCFSNLGRHCFDIINSLGYAIDFAVESTISDDFNYSLMPLLSYYKLYQDWYRNPNYDFAWPIVFPVTSQEIASLDIRVLVSSILESFRYAFYERDYFTSAWDNPNSPNPLQSFGSMYLSDVSQTGKGPTSVNKVVNDAQTGTPVIKREDNTQAGTAVAPLTKFILDGLKLMTDYVKRHQLAGTQAMERYLARFGIVLDDAKLNRSNYLGKSVTPVQISDIMNQTSPQSDDAAVLGEYAGRGVGQGQGHFEIKTNEKEYGQVFLVSVVVPKIMYVQGADRALQHINRLDFWTPEFDSLGMQAIRQDELLARNMDSNGDGLTSLGDGVFGFTSRYAEYKNAVDRVTGDFLMRLEDETSDNARYHLARIFPIDGTYPVHSLEFTRAQPYQFNRIFADSNSDFDHFINIFFFNVHIQQPMSRMYDDYEFEDEDNGKPVSMPLGGVQKD